MDAARVAIGVRVETEPRLLYATLAALRSNTPPGARVLLLPDDPDAETRQALTNLRNLPQIPETAGRGAAACFNRLVAGTDEPLLLLLEGGALPAPRWLETLLHGLDADPRNGLAGPSTNRSWNEQAQFTRSTGAPLSLARVAREAALRYRDQIATLEPLHSLGDFCYLVRREVTAAIGGADEGYGAGPCWEMDYNIRAARAGFRAVWVRAAFVHRAPASARRRADEARLFEASRRRYQDRLCGQRLRGERSEYEPHCTGDACADFAPAGLIPLRAALPPRLHVPTPIAPPRAQPPPAQPPVAPRPLRPAGAPAQGRVTASGSGEPLVSCIMPTYNRRDFLSRGVACVLKQDYSRFELIIVDDGSDPVGDCLPADSRIRYLRLGERRTIGHKRNLACGEARGEIIVHFDDDDWYPRWRVRRQVEALRDAEVSGTSQLYYLEHPHGRAWRYHYTGAAPWVAGNTLAYRRRVWTHHPFADVQVGEDSRFVRALRPAQVADLADPSLCVATVHAGNTSPKAVGKTYWTAEDGARVRRLVAEDELPLISCIMPTANRRPFVKLALEHFAQQSWPARELIVVDDGADPVEDLVRGAPDVRYLRLARKTTIGGKRNLACREARGTLIAHWDDDDFYGPDRLRRQVEPILRGEADLTGLTMSHVLHLDSGQFWTAKRELHKRMFVGDVPGGTLMYRESLLRSGLRYPEVNLAEDAALIQQATARGHRLLRVETPGLFVYVRHGKNTWQFESGRFLDSHGWSRSTAPVEFPPELLGSYRAALARLHGRE